MTKLNENSSVQNSAFFIQVLMLFLKASVCLAFGLEATMSSVEENSENFFTTN